MKKIILVAIPCVVLGISLVLLTQDRKADVFVDGFNPKNTTYTIAGESIPLVDGFFTKPAAPDSSSIVTVQYFGNEAYGDIDGDGDQDVSFLLTQDGGGSGIFFYLVAALKEGDTYRGSDAMFIGDRIAPQNTRYQDGLVIVNYADRRPGEAMAAVPSFGKSLYAKYDKAKNSFGEVVRDFEGEADPAHMSITMKPWQWMSASYNDGRVIAPKKPGMFTLTFEKDGSFSAKTDCNSVGGMYGLEGDRLSFREMTITTMYCEGSQEKDFIAFLNNTSGYHFTSRGELILELKFDSGTVTFR